MKLTLLSWKTRNSALWHISGQQFREEVCRLIYAIAEDRGLVLAHIGLYEENLEIVFCGQEALAKSFMGDFKKRLYALLKRIAPNFSHKALTNTYSIISLSSKETTWSGFKSEFPKLRPKAYFPKEDLFEFTITTFSPTSLPP